MLHDGTLSIALGMSAKTRLWKNKEWTWSELVCKLRTEYKTNETFNEFISSSKEDQSKIKDVGGFVGGYLRNGRRKPENVEHRQILTLDIDFAHPDFWDDFTLQFGNAAVLHGTHKHCPTSPRYRLIMPLSREAAADEYVAVARYVAGLLDIDLFDKTTFQPCRLMFWPSNSKDVEYYCETQEGEWLDVDGILNTYADWTDSSLWPTAESEFQTIKDASLKQQDPTTKKGVIGAFCRTYTVSEVISLFLSDTYELTTGDRYTYLKGSASSGVITYEDKHAYSHHGTDPISGKLCNAFDLVRIHNFGHLDQNVMSNEVSSKSFKAMQDFARNDERTRKTVAAETVEEAKYDFAEGLGEDDTEESTDWMAELEINAKSEYLATAFNINLIFANDPRLNKTFKRNTFDSKGYVCKNLPWRKIKDLEPIRDVDYSGVRNYIETIYGIASKLKVEDSLALVFEKQNFHPIRDYLNATEWDKIKRVDTLLIDCFGVEDNLYSREAIRKMLVGAVARVFNPGIKFDLVLTLVSPEQGTGKSTFLNKLGGDWFSDTFLGVTGTKALEQVQGAWIIEMAELAGLRKADIEAVKHFISKRVDTFRHAYGHVSEDYRRQCVFAGTTNDKEFLNDPSGNRRFMPIDVRDSRKYLSVFSDEFDKLVPLIWAEAVELYRKGEKLYLSPEAEAIAKNEQIVHSATDERRGLIELYLDKKLPEDWAGCDIDDRRTFLAVKGSEGKELKDFVCIAEIWCECLGKEKEDMSRYNTRDINGIMRSLLDWEPGKSPRNFPLYGKQKYYSRKLT